MKISTFGYRNGIPYADFLFDCRKLKNPHNDPALRPLDGRAVQIKTFVEHDPKFQELYGQAKFHALTYPKASIAFGCFGGRHRSVAMAELLAEDLRLQGHEVEVTHMALED
jgi:UPF0042 nucleotide-binding protein